MIRHTRMIQTRQVPAYVTGNGFVAICPTCGEPNRAEFGGDGQLVWWPNKVVGMWCRHAQGAYQGGGSALATVFQFVYLPNYPKAPASEVQALVSPDSLS